MFARKIRMGPLVTAGLAAASFVAACGGGEKSDVVSPIAASVDLTTSALTALGGGEIKPVGIVGTYGQSCKVHAAEAWDLRLNDPMDRSVEIALNDTFANCPLTLQRIQVEVGPTPLEFTVVPPVVLGLDYMPSPAAVNQVSPLALAFYSNARLEDLAGPVYTNDFAINMLYSDNAVSCGNFAPPAIYATVDAAAIGSAVPPPAYGVGYDGLQLLVDANQVVQPFSIGAVLIEPQGQPGEEWKLFDEGTSCCKSYSFLEIDSIYQMFGPVAAGTISGTETLQFPPDALALVGRTLPEIRTLIIKHTGEGGVYSYELIQIVFTRAQ